MNIGDGIISALRQKAQPTTAPFRSLSLSHSGGRMVMSQRSRPAYLDDGVDGDGDVLNRSWDVESRYRLQESALNLPREKTAALFRVQVELGLHELTAAMSSLR